MLNYQRVVLIDVGGSAQVKQMRWHRGGAGAAVAIVIRPTAQVKPQVSSVKSIPLSFHFI